MPILSNKKARAKLAAAEAKAYVALTVMRREPTAERLENTFLSGWDAALRLFDEEWLKPLQKAIAKHKSTEKDFERASKAMDPTTATKGWVHAKARDELIELVILMGSGAQKPK